jgi:NTE family protein
MTICLKNLIIIFLLATTFVGHADKVAVVLSGGGAKGFSHIGVLKALEENNIPIDYITGTSMGAIIGGLYASGYSPEEIEKLMTSPQFMEWASGKINKAYIHYYKLPDPNSSSVSIPFKINQKFDAKIPLTLVPTHVMDFTFMELFAGPSAAADYKFDSLFIPFRCVAADIEAKEEVVFSEGQLGDALRASMAVPFYFSPIKINGKLLFDGGMYNNFPVDIANKEFKPDVIIGSKAASNFKPPVDDDIVSQLQNMLMEKVDYNYIPGKGVIIKPDLGEMDITDFGRAKEFIDSGYIHTIKQIEFIRSLLERRSNPDSLKRKRIEFYKRIPAIIIDSIKINGVNSLQANYINKQIENKNKSLVSLIDFKNNYYGLVADDKIRSVYPRLTYNKTTGHYDLSLDVKRVDKFMAEFGGNLSSNAYNMGFVGVHYKHWNQVSADYGVELNFGRFYSAIALKARVDIPAKLPFFINIEHTSHVRDYFKNSSYFIDDIDPSYLVQKESYFRAALGIPINNQSKLLGGFTFGQLKDEYYQTNNFTSSDHTDVSRFDFFSPYIKYEYNTLNRKSYATEGMRISASYRYVWGNEDHIPGKDYQNNRELIDFSENRYFFQISGAFEKYIALYKGVKLGIYGEIYFSDQSFFNNYTATILAAKQFQPTLESSLIFLPMFRAHKYAAFGLRDIIPLSKSIDLRLEGYLFYPEKSIMQNLVTKNPFYSDRYANRYFIVSASVVLTTPFGPISIMTNYYSEHKDNFSIMFNAGFYLFNKSAID